MDYGRRREADALREGLLMRRVRTDSRLALIALFSTYSLLIHTGDAKAQQKPCTVAECAQQAVDAAARAEAAVKALDDRLRKEPATVVMVPHRIGPTGEQTPEQIAKQGGVERYFTGPLNGQLVPESHDRVCMISRTEFHNGGGTCTLVHRGGHSPWEISVQDIKDNNCQVTCFDLTVSR
jgi:hypothetical protein